MILLWVGSCQAGQGTGEKRGARHAHSSALADLSTRLRQGYAGQAVNCPLSAVSAYCPLSCCCGPHARGVTASGKPVTANGGVFVAHKTLPFGTMVTIPGYHGGRPVPVLDRGPYVAGREFDVYFPTHRAAKAWGIKRLTTKVTKGTKGRRQ